jgi:glutamyl-tRNA reductase
VNNELFYIGLTHQTAPLAIREKLRADRERQAGMLTDLSTFAGGRMVLATCERFEVYATTDQVDVAPWITRLAEWFQLPADVLRGCVQTFVGAGAAEHLLRVAAGLESRIVGERQILGQVRNAFQFAAEQDSLDAPLSTLARAAICTGKRVRQETALGDGARSIVTVAMDWLAETHGGLNGRSLVVVGSGRLAALAVDQAVQRGPRRMVIVGRNEDRAAELAGRFGVSRLGMDALASAVAEADVVLTCTASPSYLIEPSSIGIERTRPLLLIDLSVPRNVDPAVARLPNVTLGHLDELVEHGLQHSRCSPAPDAIRRAEEIVLEELRRFLQWRRGRQAATAIADLCRGDHVSDKRELHRRIMRMKAEVAA